MSLPTSPAIIMDPCRSGAAKTGPFGATIAHGYLTLAGQSVPAADDRGARLLGRRECRADNCAFWRRCRSARAFAARARS